MPHIQRVSDDTESPLRMLVITGSRPPAENAGDRNAFRATNGLENLKQTLAAFIPYRTGKDESDTHLSLATMNSRPRQIRRAFFTRIRILGGQIKFDQEPVRGMWRKRPRAGDVDVSASKVSLLEVPAMAISSATPGSGCGRTC